MNHLATSKEEILAASRELIKENGWAAVSISSVVFTGFKVRQPKKQEKSDTYKQVLDFKCT